jgi:hypothetical protein
VTAVTLRDAGGHERTMSERFLLSYLDHVFIASNVRMLLAMRAALIVLTDREKGFATRRGSEGLARNGVELWA